MYQSQAIISKLSTRSSVFALLIFLLASNCHASPPVDIKVLVTGDLIKRQQTFVNGRNLLEISDYSSSQSGRHLAEALLFQQALALVHYKNITLLDNPKRNYRSRIDSIINAEVAAMAETGWCADGRRHPDHISVTSPVIRQGEFQVGIYTRSDNKALLNIDNIQQLGDFSAVTNSQWSADWRTLNAIPNRKLYDINNWDSHLKMLASGRADFMLLPLQNNKDMVLHYDPVTEVYLQNQGVKTEGIRLIPIPGIKIQLYGERCFFVSRKHPEGKAMFSALESGLKQLRAKGLIVKALNDSKFFHPATKDWVVIN